MRITKLASAVVLLWAVGCGKSDTKPDKTPEPTATQTPPAPENAELDVGALAEAVGVAPGAVSREGPGIAAVTAVKGSVAVRKLGEESFQPAGVDAELHAGDQLRAETGSKAVVALVDGSVVEVAEDSAVAVGDRQASAEIASSIAVLYGVARFTVAERGPGEGPFIILTPSGIAAAKGTVVTAGVLVSGSARFGVEEGVVEVAGAAALDAAIEVAAGAAAAASAAGEVTAESDYDAAAWASWRDEAEAEIDAAAAAEARAEMLAATEAALIETYGTLDARVTAASEIEAEATGYVEADKRDDYARTAGDWATDLEATFLLSMRAQHLTYAMASHGYVVTELYRRHPKKVEPTYKRSRAYTKGAILYSAKLHAVIGARIRPLRAAYHNHHPRGRATAKASGEAVIDFFAKTKINAPEPAAVRARAKAAVYVPPKKLRVKAGKKVWFDAPPSRWHASMKVKPAAYKGEGWYKPPAKRRAAVITGAEAKTEVKAVFKGAASGGARVAGNVRIGVAKSVSAAGSAGSKAAASTADSVKAAGSAGVKVTGQAGADTKASGATAVKTTGAAAVKTGAKVVDKASGAAEVKAGAKVKPDVKVKGDVKGKAGGAVKGAGEAAGKTGGAVKGAGEAAGKTGGAVKGAAKGGVKAKGEVKSKVKLGL